MDTHRSRCCPRTRRRSGTGTPLQAHRDRELLESAQTQAEGTNGGHVSHMPCGDSLSQDGRITGGRAPCTLTESFYFPLLPNCSGGSREAAESRLPFEVSAEGIIFLMIWRYGAYFGPGDN